MDKIIHSRGVPEASSNETASPIFTVPEATRPVATRPRKGSRSIMATSMANGAWRSPSAEPTETVLSYLEVDRAAQVLTEDQRLHEMAARDVDHVALVRVLACGQSSPRGNG